MRALGWLMAGVFVFAGSVQWNDPDPLAWMAFYGLAAVASLGVALARREPVWRWLERAACAVSAAVVVALLPSIATARFEAFTSFHMKSSDDEVVRELVGAAVALVWTGVLVLRRRRAAPDAPDPA